MTQYSRHCIRLSDQ